MDPRTRSYPNQVVAMSFRTDLERRMAGRVRIGEPLRKHTTFRIGGPADYYASPRSPEEISDLLALAKAEGIPVHILGNGSNLIISDEGVRGLVVHVSRRLGGVSSEGLEVTAGAGTPLTQMMQYAARGGLEGMEWACGIPGTVGGAVLTNAGTPAGQMGDRIVRIDVVEPEGGLRTLQTGDFQFSYRKSSIRGTHRVVVGATVLLEPGDRERILERIQEYNQRRLLTQPVGTWNSGCIFKNAPPHRIGREIERAGLKGKRVGHAMISTVHGNFIVNEGQARAQDVLELIAEVKSTLETRLGVRLEEEVEIWA